MSETRSKTVRVTAYEENEKFALIDNAVMRVLQCNSCFKFCNLTISQNCACDHLHSLIRRQSSEKNEYRIQQCIFPTFKLAGD